MRISRVEITNYRALKDVAINLSSFGCLIGENNAGKSSLLQALLRFCEPKPLPPTDYYDERLPVRISLTFTNVSETDLALIHDEENRNRIRELVVNGSLKLVRVFPLDAKSELRCFPLLPKDSRLRRERVDEDLKGKKGAPLVEFVEQTYPELKGQVDAKSTLTAVKELIASIRRNLPPEHLVEEESVLPTGISQSVSPLFPEPIYIPAVKNFADDYKTGDSATFGKVLKLLLDVIEPLLSDEKSLFDKLEKKLNASEASDERLEEIKVVEKAIEKNLKENFPQASVHLKIPPPDIKTILQNAQIDVHDGGVRGPVESKGDGLKRSVVFSIFRSYVDLLRQPGWNKKLDVNLANQPHYLFLFEEPELYLHPKAQKILFDSLSEVSKTHQVVVTTHSPLFFSADSTTTFAKLSKREPIPPEQKPVSILSPVDLELDIPAKDAFQLICYENNNAAFFATDILLVEGDSDLIVFKHIAKLLDPSWDFDKGRVMMVRVNGKGNFKRYRSFFKRFGVRTCILTDLDFLVRDFDKAEIPLNDPIIEARHQLLAEIDKYVTPTSLKGDDIKRLFEKATWKEKWTKFISVAKGMKEGVLPAPEQLTLLEMMLNEEMLQPRLEGLKHCAKIQSTKASLLNDLRIKDIYVLSRGCIEDYFPDTILGSDKPSKAEDLRRKVTNRAEVLTLANEVPDRDGNRNEFEAIFSSVFSSKPPIAVK